MGYETERIFIKKSAGLANLGHDKSNDEFEIFLKYLALYFASPMINNISICHQDQPIKVEERV